MRGPKQARALPSTIWEQALIALKAAIKTLDRKGGTEWTWPTNCVEKAGVQVDTVRAGIVNLSNPAGRAVARTLGAWARY